MSESSITTSFMKQWREYPTCCAEMRRVKSIQLGYLYGMEYSVDTKPQWTIYGFIKEPNYEIRMKVEAKFCPFCAKPVPEIEKKLEKDIPKVIQKITDGGYYCNTCSERCNECECAPCWSAWRAKPEV